MIELRWVNRKMSMPTQYVNQATGETWDIPGADPDDFRWVRVLQFRLLGEPSYLADPHGYVTGCSSSWGEWNDVPEISEPQLPAEGKS